MSHSMHSIPVPIVAGAALLAAGGAGLCYATRAPRSQLLGRTDWRGPTDTASVALTFDDGPGEWTERVLEVLSAYKLQATFFVLGRQVVHHGRVARLVASEGHEIGNHSYSHPSFLRCSPRETWDQLARAQQAIAETTGIPPRLARPPYLIRTPAYFAATRRLGLRTVQCDVIAYDWRRRSGAEIAHTVLRQAHAGAIILLHDADCAGKRDRHATVLALPTIITGLRQRGLRLVRVSELLEVRATDNTPGRVR